jgi:transcriptional regulator with XRE-family HTH domain
MVAERSRAGGASRLDSGAGNRHAGLVDESRQWVEFGRWLVEQREERGLRRRDAARRAKISEALWRDLETGRKEAIGGIRLLPNPSQDVLERVATALELPVEDVLARVGRATAGRRRPAPSADVPKTDDDGSLLSVKLRRLSERDRILLERLVDAMLEHEDR